MYGVFRPSHSRKGIAKEWLPIQIVRLNPSFSHLFFVYDIILVAKASIQNIDCIKSILDKFYAYSSFNINVGKSKIFFSKNAY